MAVKQLSIQQQLLLAQAVHQVGEPQDFVKVVGLLKTHPLLLGGAARVLATPEACHSAYAALQQSHPTESSPSAAKVRPSFALARTLYYRRIEELKNAISSEEAKFRILNAEIEEIKRGEWDDKLRDPEERDKVLKTSAFGEVEEKKEEKEEPDVEEEASNPERDKGKKKTGRPRRGTLVEEEEDVVADSQEEEDEAPKKRGRPSKGGRKPSIVRTPSNRKSRSRAAKEEEEEEEEEEEDAMEVDSPAAREDKGTKRKATETPSATSPKRARRSSGAEEPPAEPATPSVDPAVFRRRILQIQSQLSQHTCSSPFREPVRESDAPDYTSIIKRPMDLKAIAKRIREGKVATPDEFRRDVLLMLSNAVVYNRPDSEVAKNAKDMLELVENLVDLYVSTQYS